MIALMFVADGPRDKATLPLLVRNIVDEEVRAHFEPWARLNRHPGGHGTGYGRKLKFATRQALRSNLQGLVAAVDHDGDDERLRGLQTARAEDRRAGVELPTAVGCAEPHSEKWLVSDETALGACFPRGTPDEFKALKRSRDPKTDLDRMFKSHGVDALDGLRTLAENIQATRCHDLKASGLEAFVTEVADEIAPLAK